jgi:hypothetical protein
MSQRLIFLISATTMRNFLIFKTTNYSPDHKSNIQSSVGNKKRESVGDPVLFFPKALNINLYGRSSDLSRFHEAFP